MEQWISTLRENFLPYEVCNLLASRFLTHASRDQNVLSHCSAAAGAQHWQCQSGTSSGDKHRLAHVPETFAVHFSLF